MLTIVLDLDDTLVSSAPAQLECINQAYGTAFTHQDFEDAGWHWLDLLDRATVPLGHEASASDLRQAFLTGQLLEKSRFDSGCPEVWLNQFRAWQTVGHKIIICTARGWHPSAVYVTQNLLKELNLYCEVVVVAHDGLPKILKLHSMGIYPDLMVDDSPSEIRGAMKAGVPLIVWNSHSWVEEQPFRGSTYSGAFHQVRNMHHSPEEWLRRVINPALAPLAMSHALRSRNLHSLKTKADLAQRLARKVLSRAQPHLLKDELATLKVLAG